MIIRAVGDALNTNSLPRAERAIARLASQWGVTDSLTQAASHLDGGSPKQRMAQLTFSGMLRLDDTDFVTEIRTFDRALAIANEPLCAAVARGQTTDSVIYPLLGSLDDSLLDRWAAVVVRAGMAEARRSPPPVTTTEAETRAFLVSFLQSLSPADSARFVKASGAPNAASDAESCWLQRSFVHYAASAPPGEQASRARLLYMLLRPPVAPKTDP